MTEKASQIQKIVQDKRILSLTQEKQLAFTGSNRLEKSVEEPASYFLSNSNGAWKIRSVDYYLSIWVKNSQNIQLYCNKGFPYRGDLLDVAGVRLFMLPEKLSNAKYQTIGKWKDDFLILNSEASENLRWVDQSADLPDTPSVLNILAQPHSEWRKKVYLEKNSTGSYIALAPAERNLTAAPALNNGHFINTPSRLSAFFEGPGYVIFNDSYAPGWHTWVDGSPQPILKADGLFMTVYVPKKGLFPVDFRYEPSSFRLGLFFSMLSLWFLLLITAWKGVNEKSFS